MTKAVLDSTILVSAFLVKSGPANQLLHEAEAGVFTVCLCPEILEETRRVLLEYERIRKRYRYSDEAAERYVQLLALVSNVSTDLPDISGVVRDPNDDMVIACAVKAKADYIVTRDKDLLSLGKYKKIEVIGPEEFIQLVLKQS